MYGHRVVTIQSAPSWAPPYSQYDFLHFSNWKTRPPGTRVVSRQELVEWDVLNNDEITDDLVQMISDPLFRIPAPWKRTAGPAKMSNLEKWARISDPNARHYRNRMLPHRRLSEIHRKSLAFESIRMPNGAEKFVEVLATTLKEKDVVFGALPPGYGKTVSARLVIEKLIDEEMREVEQSGPMTINRSALDLPNAMLTKSLHLTPSATNAASAAQYSCRERMIDTSVNGYVHSMIDFAGWKDPSTEGIDHIFIPYREAEWLIDIGRFKVIVIDEVHLDDTAIISCLMRCLNAMTEVTELDDAHCYSVPRRRVDKCLILTATNSPQLEAQIKGLVDAHSHLRYKYVKIPHLDSNWSTRRFALNKSCLHAPGVQREWNELDYQYENNLYRTPISQELALVMRDVHSKYTDVDFIEEDEKLTAAGGLYECPTYVVNRVVAATEVLMKKFIKEAEEMRDEKAKRKKDLLEMENEMRNAGCTEATFMIKNTRSIVNEMIDTPHKIPNILVFSPSTGVAKKIVNELRGSKSCINYLDPSALVHDSVHPYDFVTCSRTTDKEDALVNSPNGIFVEFVKEKRPYDDPKPEPPTRYSRSFVKGMVIIVVNGAEAGLTIDNIGGIVESGLERLRTPNVRSGMSYNLFKMSDYELVQQRAGRGGRSRETEHITCLGHFGMRTIRERGSSILEEKRRGEMTIVDYIRRQHDPRASDFRTLQHTNWNETTVEGRVSGVLVEMRNHTRTAENLAEIERTGKSELKVEPSFDALKAAKLFPNLHPSLSRMLIAYVNAKMALHGIIRVGLLATQSNAMMKPSRTSTAESIVGPTPRMNTLDIFRLAIRSYTHGGSGTKCLPQPYRGDTPAVTDFHAQLVVAAQWNFADPVPTKDQLVNTLGIPPENFFGGAWMPCGPFNKEEELENRMDNRRSKEKGGIHFTYTRLVVDEERKALWSWMRNAAYDLTMMGYIDKPEDLLSKKLNEHVHNLQNDPLLTLTGRSLICAIDTMYSTRFGKAISRGQNGKMRGEFHEYFMEYDGYDNRGRPVVVQRKLKRKVRAECSWNPGEKTTWIRFDPAIASTRPDCKLVPVPYPWTDEDPPVLQLPYVYVDEQEDVPLDETFITTCDSITDAQAALFANGMGRWRVVTEKEGSKESTLEVELNARDAYYGMAVTGDTKTMNAIGDFRLWMRSNIPFSKYRDDPGQNYEKALKKLVEIWDLADHRTERIPYKDRDTQFLD